MWKIHDVKAVWKACCLRKEKWLLSELTCLRRLRQSSWPTWIYEKSLMLVITFSQIREYTYTLNYNVNVSKCALAKQPQGCEAHLKTQIGHR